MWSRTIGAGALALGLVFGGAASAQQKTISIGTGGTGGIYYPLGGAVANVLSKYVSNLQVTAEVTGGGLANLQLVASGQSEIGFAPSDIILDALNGVEKFKKKVPLRTLAVLYASPMHVVTVEGTGIERIADLKGKRVSTGAPGSQTEVMAFRLLEVAGVDKEADVRRERLSVAESAAALKDRKIDAFFWGGGVPTAAVTDLAVTPGIRIKLVDYADLGPKLNAKFGPLYATGTIPAGSYPGQDRENRAIALWNMLVTDDRMSDDLAYAITKTLIEKRPELVAVHKEATSLTLDNQTQDKSPAPFHPGSLKYLKEVGAGG